MTACLLLALSGCGTPQERCIAAATRETATLDRLIGESEAALRRGYTYQYEEVTRWQWVRCDQPIAGPTGMVPAHCWLPTTTTVRKPLAIDPEAESRKLENLMQRRAALMRDAEPKIAFCRSAYPEG